MKHQPYLLIFYSILTAGGILSGIAAWLFLPDMLSDALRSYTAGQLQNMADYTLQDTIVQVCRANLLDLLRVYLCGLCLVGVPLLILFLFLKCFAVGFSFILLLQSSIPMVLSRLIFIPVLLLAVLKGYRFSLALLSGTQQNAARQWLTYTLYFAALLLCMVLVSAVDGLACYVYLSRL